MKIHKPIGSKERFLEMFQDVNKMKLNEYAFGAVNPVEAAFDELVSGNMNIEQVNNQVNGDESIVEIAGKDSSGNDVVFKFSVQSQGTDQEGVNQIQDVKMVGAVIGGNSYDDDGGLAVINAGREQDMIDAVSEYVEFESDVDTVSDEMYEEAIKFIDKVPYNKGTEDIQTSKAYGDEKPTNPDVRVKAPELDQFVNEIQDYVPDEEEEQDVDPMALPDMGDMEIPDDGTTGVDPYDQELDYSNEPMEQVSPEKAAVINQAYDNLVQAGNPSPTGDDVMREINRLQGTTKPVEKTRTIPKGAEDFWEGAGDGIVKDMDYNTVVSQSYDAVVPDKVKNLMIQRADEALTANLGVKKFQMPREEYLQKVKELALIVYQRGAAAVNEDETKEPSTPQEYAFQRKYGDNWEKKRKEYLDKSTLTDDDWKELDDKMSSIDEDEEDYPKQMGKKFKPKNQMPKKKKKPQTVVKLTEKEGRVPKPDYKHGIQSFDWTPDEKLRFMELMDAKGFRYEMLGNDGNDPNDGVVIEVGAFDDPEIKALMDSMKHYDPFAMEEEPELNFKNIGGGIVEEEDVEQVEKEKEEVGDMIAGGKADGESPEKFDQEQIKMGLKVEMEHTDDPMVAIEITMDHLTEFPDYYTRLDKMEKQAKGDTKSESVEVSDTDSELTDELLGFKPHNVGDYASEEFDHVPSADAERQYWDKEYYNQDQEKEMGGEEKEEIIDEEEFGYEEYTGNIGDRYQDGEGNQFTVRDKVKGGVTLQGQGGESEIATSDIKFLKKLSEGKPEKKEIITEEQLKTARQVLKNRDFSNGMTKKEAVQILIKHNIN